jgi:thiol-disulfide isomerase/thioredoxin
MRIVLLAAAVWMTFAAAGGGVEVPLDVVDGVAPLTTEGSLQAIGLVGSETLEGSLRLSGCDRAVRVELAADVAPRLSADLSGRGVLETVEWDIVSADGSCVAWLPLLLPGEAGVEEPAAYRLLVIWSPSLPTALVYVRDTYRAGQVELGGRAVRLAVVDEDSDGAYDDLQHNALIVDVDGDGRLSAAGDSHERFALGEPFSLDGRTYAVTAATRNGSRITVEESPVSALPKPALLPSFPAPLFEANDLDGQRLSLGELRGHIVLLDFWAGWCAPCVAELPTIRRVQEDYASRGVVVVGVCMDRSEAACRAAVSEHGIATAQIFDGPDGALGALYRIQGIPMMYLIDRDGTIWARGLRGETLLAEVDALVGRVPEDDGG